MPKIRSVAICSCSRAGATTSSRCCGGAVTACAAGQATRARPLPLAAGRQRQRGVDAGAAVDAARGHRRTPNGAHLVPHIGLVNVMQPHKLGLMLSSAELPNDIDALKALLLASERLVRERDAPIATQSDALLNLQAHSTTPAAEQNMPSAGSAPRRCAPSADTPGPVPGRAKGRCVFQVPPPLRTWCNPGNGLLGARVPQIPRPACGPAIATDRPGTAAYRRTVCNRSRDSRETTRRTSIRSARMGAAAVRRPRALAVDRARQVLAQIPHCVQPSSTP